MKKKICFILPWLGNGGAEKVAYHLLQNLDKTNYELFLILTKEKGEYFKDLNKDIKAVILNKKRSRYAVFGIIKNIKEIKPDIVITFSFEIAIIVGNFIKPFFKNIKFINRQVNIISRIELKPLKKKLLVNSYSNFDKIITQSRDMTEDLLKNININKKKIIEVNNPVNIDEIKKISSKNIEIEFKPEDKNLLCVGRLSKQKGFDLIIKIMAVLKNKNIKLYILGEGEQRQELTGLIKKLNLEDRVFLLGRKDNPYVYMRNADLFILSSRYEGFPNVLLEAGSCGLYSICNDSPGGINEIIEENINGNIVDFNNKKRAKQLIFEKIYLEKNKVLIKQNILKKYKLEKILFKYEKLLNNELN